MNTQQQNVLSTGVAVGLHQPQILISQPSPRSPDEFKPSSSSQMKGLSGLQITMGILSIIFAIVLYSLEPWDDQGADAITYISHGIWMGLILILDGGLGACSATSKNSCLITAVMVLNIMTCSIFSLSWVSLSSIGLIMTSDGECHDELYTVQVYEDGYWDYTYDCDWDWWNGNVCGWNNHWVEGYYTTAYRYREVCNEDGISSVFYALFGLLTAFALIEFIIAIWISALCCGAVCRCCKSQVTPTVQYINTQPSMVIQHTTQSSSTSYPSAPPAYPSVPAHQPVGYQTAHMNPYPQQYGYAPNPYGMVPQQHVGFYQAAPGVYQQQPQHYPQPAGIHQPAPAAQNTAPSVQPSTSQAIQPPPQRNPLPPINTQNRPPTYSAALHGRKPAEPI